ncbi:hypothetical protein GDO81_007033 [Engystomops pustulosus]|uniref:Uncharacterized protein n=1 Tax=Engystomops pustulosus TaxID=76066 RepID=A0AAV7D2I2_ENGPU|nr:hypothetical protein GDO81_007033 [Engystomops pustulosus]
MALLPLPPAGGSMNVRGGASTGDGRSPGHVPSCDRPPPGGGPASLPRPPTQHRSRTKSSSGAPPSPAHHSNNITVTDCGTPGPRSPPPDPAPLCGLVYVLFNLFLRFLTTTRLPSGSFFYFLFAIETNVKG